MTTNHVTTVSLQRGDEHFHKVAICEYDENDWCIYFYPRADSSPKPLVSTDHGRVRTWKDLSRAVQFIRQRMPKGYNDYSLILWEPDND